MHILAYFKLRFLDFLEILIRDEFSNFATVFAFLRFLRVLEFCENKFRIILSDSSLEIVMYMCGDINIGLRSGFATLRDFILRWRHYDVTIFLMNALNKVFNAASFFATKSCTAILLIIWIKWVIIDHFWTSSDRFGPVLFLCDCINPIILVNVCFNEWHGK